MDERPKLPHYDPDYCLKIATWAASICVGILAFELLVLLFVAPSDKCPGWAIYAENGSATSAWIFVGLFTGLPTIWICYVVLRWEQKFSQQMYDAIAYRDNRSIFPNLGFGTKPKPDRQQLDPELNFEQIFLLNANALFLRVCIGWCLFCVVPLVLMIAKCTSAPRYLGY
ncbi:MAG TPA: hypothetical protein VN941_10450 [Bradyrhizobium sp.]|nr:hypothetical protein [Bradyrhizobium sp.]